MLGGGYTLAKGPEIISVSIEPIITGGIYHRDGWHATASRTDVDTGTGDPVAQTVQLTWRNRASLSVSDKPVSDRLAMIEVH